MELHHRLRLRRPGPYLLDHESILSKWIDPSRNRTSSLLRVMQALDRGAPGPDRQLSPRAPPGDRTRRFRATRAAHRPLMLEGRRSCGPARSKPSPGNAPGKRYIPSSALPWSKGRRKQLPGVAPGPRGWQPRVSLSRPELQSSKEGNTDKRADGGNQTRVFTLEG